MDYNPVINRINTLLNQYDHTPHANRDALNDIKNRVNEAVGELEMMVRIDMEEPDKKTQMLDSIKGRVRAMIEGREVVKDKLMNLFPKPPLGPPGQA